MSKRAIIIVATLGVIIAVLVIASNTYAGGTILSKLSLIVSEFSINPQPQAFHKKAGLELLTSCNACHGTMKSEETPWHKKHLTASLTNFACSTCHKKVTTGKRSLVGKVLIDRSVCLKCHQQKFSAYTANHQKSDWINRHKLLKGIDKGNCLKCHKYKELNFCGQCHDFHSHDKQWIFGGHGKKAVKTDFACLRCHEKKKWCTTQCHQGVTLPHNIPKWSKHWKGEPNAPLWRKVHFRFAEKLGVEVCQRCHKFKIAGREFCQKCHHRQFIKEMLSISSYAWATKRGGMAFVKKNGASRCWECHDAAFCAYCHTTGKKPPKVNFTRNIEGSN